MAAAIKVPFRRVRAFSGKGTTFEERSFHCDNEYDAISEMMSSSPRKCMNPTCGKFTSCGALRKQGSLELFPACIECRDVVGEIMKTTPSPPELAHPRNCAECRQALSWKFSRIPMDGEEIEPLIQFLGEPCIRCQRVSFCSIDCRNVRFVQSAKHNCPHCTKCQVSPRALGDETE